MIRVLVVLSIAMSGCDGCGNDGSRHIVDSPAPFLDSPKAFHDAALFDASNPLSDMLIAQSPAGPANGDITTWEGVLQFSVSGDGATLVPEGGLAKTVLEDPVGLAFDSATSEVFVGNRHGNNAADGTAGSISRFHYDQGSHSLTPEPEVLGNGLAGVHQVTFSPTTGEMFAANVNTAVSRFTFDANGVPVPNGTISSGPTRGVLVSPDGKRLFATTASNVLRQFDLTSNTELAPITLSTAGNLHFLAFRLNDLYVAALDDNEVYRYHLDADDNLTFVQQIDAASPIGVAFSADGAELFVTGHRTVDLLQRYTFDSASDTWTANGTIDLGSSLGGILILPG